MGANLARIAHRNLAGFPRVRVDTVRFEDWEPGSLSFDIVLAVTSWHWLDPQLRYAKAAQVLRPAGVLAFTTGSHVFPPGFDPFFAEMQDCYEAIGEARMKWPPPAPEEVRDDREEIEQSGYFENVRVTRRIWVEEFTADQHIAMMSTASDHRLMQPAKRDQLFAEMHRLIRARPGGRIRKHNLTILHLAQKKTWSIYSVSAAIG